MTATEKVLPKDIQEGDVLLLDIGSILLMAREYVVVHAVKRREYGLTRYRFTLDLVDALRYDDGKLVSLEDRIRIQVSSKDKLDRIMREEVS
jgi:hypothetical protein